MALIDSDPTGDPIIYPLRANPTLYCVAIKEVQINYIHLPCDSLPLHIEFRPRISGRTRIIRNDTQ